MPKWISTKDRLPTHDEQVHSRGRVIVAYEDGTVQSGWYSEAFKGWSGTERHGEALWWMPFPEHPGESEVQGE